MNYYLKIFLFSVFTTIYTLGQTKNIDSNNSLINTINSNLSKAFSYTSNYKYDKALSTTLQCIQKADSIQNDSLLGKGYLIIGIINSSIGKKNQALLNHKKAETIFIKTKNYKYLGSAYTNIGEVYRNLNKELRADNKSYIKNLDSIKKYYQKALHNYTLSKNQKRISTGLYNLGAINILLNKLDSTDLLLKKALKIAKVHNKSVTGKSIIGLIYISFSEISFKKNNFKQSLKYLNLAEKLTLKYQHNDALLTVYDLKHKTLYKLKDKIGALNYLKKHNNLLMRKHENEKSELTLGLSTKFEAKEQTSLLEKKRLENSLKESKLIRLRQLAILSIILLIISFFATFLLKKYNFLKKKSSRLLMIKNKKLKTFQVKTELDFLKTQIQPHFFFNTLNNLYALILVKSDKSIEVISKLSELMKYTMFGTKDITVPINEEINNIKNYLELEKLRYEEKTFPNIEIDGEMKKIQGPPLLFITFIENSFKHNDVADKNFKLSITFKALDTEYLFFKVYNTITTPIKRKKRKRKGIGLENIKRRLKLIYGNNYNLTILHNKDSYCVSLKIPISNSKLIVK